MKNSLKQRYKNAVRFFEQQQHSTWMVLAQSTPWTNTVFGNGISEAVAPVTDKQLPAQTIILDGTVTNGDVVTISFASASLTGSPLHISHTCTTGQVLADVAVDLYNKINAQSTLNGASVKAFYDVVNFPNNVFVIWPNTITDLVITSTVSGASTELVKFTDTYNPIVAVKALVALVYEDPNNGPYSIIDIHNVRRRFSTFANTGDAINGRCLFVLLQAVASGFNFNQIVLPATAINPTSFRQVAFVTDLVPGAGFENLDVLIPSQIADWGDIESYENRLTDSLTNTSQFTYGYIEQF